jgi:chitodextrinase
LVAPGGNIDQDLNADGYGDGVLQETFTAGFGWGYYFFQGTSMATPHVSAAAAMLKSLAPGLDSKGVESILEATAFDLGPSGFDKSFGNGLLQIADAIAYLKSPDTAAPAWEAGAVLGTEPVGDDGVRLSWPKANDDRGVGGYRVYVDGTPEATTTKTTHLVDELNSGEEYQFEVRALDLAGNSSAPLAASFTMPDLAPPTWQEHAEVAVAEYGEDSLTLIWSEARDDLGVTGYRVGLTGTSGIQTEQTEATLTGLEPGSSYLVEVRARDDAGNWSTPLTQSVRTARAFIDASGHLFHSEILWMSGEGITRGCNPPVNDLFCPDDPVTRAQMAAFVVRALGLVENRHPGFVDVPASSTFAGDVGRLATVGITRGCNPPVNDLFCPDDPVTRGQLAAFLERALR